TGFFAGDRAGLAFEPVRSVLRRRRTLFGICDDAGARRRAARRVFAAGPDRRGRSRPSRKTSARDLPVRLLLLRNGGVRSALFRRAQRDRADARALVGPVRRVVLADAVL